MKGDSCFSEDTRHLLGKVQELVVCSQNPPSEAMLRVTRGESCDGVSLLFSAIDDNFGYI